MAARGIVVVLDPGHGGDDPGAWGASGTPEKTYNLDIALRLGQLLERAGLGVVLTRSDDRSVSLETRVQYATQGDLWLSIHHNASRDHTARGTETLINPDRLVAYSGFLPSADVLARSVQTRVVQAIGTVDRGVQTRRDLYVLNHVTIPAALVEVCFIDNPLDEAKVIAPAGRQRVAYGLVGAIGAYTGVPVPQPVPWGKVVVAVVVAGAAYYAWRVAIPRLRETGAPGILPRPSPGPASA